MISIEKEVLYGRRYRVIVANSMGNALDVSELRCTFKITKAMSADPNYSEVDIYNLATDTETSIIQEGNRVWIEAGYEGDQYGLIYQGNVIQPIRTKEDGVTYKLSLYCLDGDKFVNNSFVAKSMVRGQDAASVIQTCVTGGEDIGQGAISEGISTAKLSRGKVLFGQPQDYLRQLAKSQNAIYYINDGEVNFVKATDLPAGEIIELNPTSGLIGEVTQTEDGISAKTLLNPRINIGTMLHIGSEFVTLAAAQAGKTTKNLAGGGVYKVIKLTHSGDTRGNEWYTDIECIAQPGQTPSLIESPENYIF